MFGVGYFPPTTASTRSPSRACARNAASSRCCSPTTRDVDLGREFALRRRSWDSGVSWSRRRPFDRLTVGDTATGLGGALRPERESSGGGFAAAQPAQAASHPELELEPGPVRAEVDDPASGRGSDSRAPALVDVAADGEPRPLVPRSPRASRCCRGDRRSPDRSTWPRAAEWTTSTAPCGQPARASRRPRPRSRSKLQSQGVTGTPAPRPKNSTPSISVPSPCSTVAAGQPAGRLAQRVARSRCCPGRAPSAPRSRPARRSSRRGPRGRGEVAGADHDVGVAAGLDEPRGAGRGRGAGR